MPHETNVVSFILRFMKEMATEDITDPSNASWRGIIKHVQTNNEQHFNSFSEAIAFIANYVRLDEFAERGNAEFPDNEHR